MKICLSNLLKKFFGVIYSTPQITLAHWVSANIICERPLTLKNVQIFVVIDYKKCAILTPKTCNVTFLE